MYRLLNIFHETWTALLQIFAFVVLYLTPISNYVHLVIVLIGIDLITGSYASIKEGQKFSASKLRYTVEKFVFYALAIIVGYVLQQIINSGSELARLVALYIGSVECKSIYENISRITRTDVMALIWEVLKGKLDMWIREIKSAKSNSNDTGSPNAA
jgi:phage-related holin